MQIEALKVALKDRATLILDEKIPPLNLLNSDKAPSAPVTK